MHVESGMLTVTEFVRAVIPHGTTGMFVDPHEIANVLGLRGVRLMVDEAARQPIHVFVQVPSCVPSAPGPGDARGGDRPGGRGGGAHLAGHHRAGGDDELPGGLRGKRQGPRGDVSHAAWRTRSSAATTRPPTSGCPFTATRPAAPQDDHEGTRLEDAVARIRQGMRVMLRYGSAWHDVAAQAPALIRDGPGLRATSSSARTTRIRETLVDEGHMDRVLRHAIAQGLAPIAALQMATLNTAEHFGVSRDIGQIAPGRYADVLLVEDLRDFRAGVVIARGKVAAQDGAAARRRFPSVTYPEWAMHSVHLAAPGRRRGFPAGRRARTALAGHRARDRRDREPGADASPHAHRARRRRAR